MVLILFQIIVAVSLIGAILLQVPGSGLSSTFGGQSHVYRSKRSLEKFLIAITIILSVVFVLLSLLLLLPQR